MAILINLRKNLTFPIIFLPIIIISLTTGAVSCSSVTTVETITIEETIAVTEDIPQPEAVPAYSYTGTRPIYPAVIHAINSGNTAHWNESIINVAGPNTVIINHVRVSDDTNTEDFSIRISLENNIITYRFYNIRQRPVTNAATPWTPMEAFSLINHEQILTEHFNKEIPKIMEDDSLYTIARENANRRIRNNIR